MLCSMDPPDFAQNRSPIVSLQAVQQQQQPLPHQQGSFHYVSPVSSSSYHSNTSIPAHSDHSFKRCRDADSDSIVSDSSVILQQAILPAQPSTVPKKSRGNAYIAPRQVDKKSLLSTMGSLAQGAAMNANAASGNLRIQFRRQLSGGKLDGFIGVDHDAMDVDNDARPRSMSF